VLELWTEVRNQVETRYVLPRSQEAIKQVISSFTAQGLVDNRGVLSGDVKTRVAERLAEDGVFIADVSITNIDFDDQYEAAVQNKQVQEQQALAQANITKQEEEKKKQAILQAEAVAEKTRLEVEALAIAQSDKVIEKILAEAQLEAAKRWNGATPSTMVVSGDGTQLPLLPYMNLGR
jgi:regulator of protease activity HflC (stomatin/prohibitin superfamily)